MIRFQQHRLLGLLIIYLLLVFQGISGAYAQNEWDIKSIANSQSTSIYFQSNPQVSIIWGYEKGDWSAAANPGSSQAIRLSELSTDSLYFSSLTTLHAGRSYWILSNNDSSPLSLSTSSIEISTYGPGYHLISGTDESVVSYLKRHPEVSQIWAWDKNKRRYSIAEQGAFPEYSSLTRVDTLEFGRGYWIKVDHQFTIYKRARIPQAVKNHAADIDTNGNIYSHGGITQLGATNQLLKYDISHDSWSLLPSAVVSRSAHSVIYHQNKLYIWGGLNEEGTPLNSMEIYDINSQQWSVITSGGQPRYSHSAIFNENKIYFWGGISDEFPYVLNTMDIYNIESGTWSLGQDGGTSRAKHQALLIDNYMYVIGGSSGTFDRYDIEADSWTLSIGPDNNRQSFGLAFIKNNILLVGGLDDLFQPIQKHSLINLGDIERFQDHEFLVERSSHQSILYEGKLYSFGGEDIFSNILDSLEVLVIDPLSKNTINSPPVVSNIGVIGGGSDLTINFDLLDEEGDFQIELEMEYSLNQGSSFHKALGFSKPLEGFKPGLSQAVVWKTLSDFASDQDNVMIRLLAKDGISISTNPVESELFDVNNGKPSVYNVTISSRPPTDKVSVEYEISDIDGDLVDISLEYSIDGGLNYQSASRISGETSSLETSSNNIYKLLWHSKEDLQSDYQNTRLRISVADVNGVSNNYGLSEIFSVLNSPNSTPSITPRFIDGSGDLIEIELAVNDQNSDLIDLRVEYRIDNENTFNLATISPQDSVKNIQPTSKYIIYWDSNLDIIDKDIQSVVLRFTPSDGREGSVASVTSNTFPIYNLNKPPEISPCTTSTPLINGNSGVIDLSLCGSDHESDTVNLYFEYSTDSQNFIKIPQANLMGQLSELNTNFSTNISWLSSEDIQVSLSSAHLRVRGFDSKEYGPWLTTELVLHNAGQWNPSSDTGINWSYVTAASDSNHAYFWGGQIDGQDTSSLLRYDLANSQISMLSSGNEARIGGSLSYVNNKLYAYGGQTKINPCEDLNCRVAVNTLEVYDLANNSWSNLTSAGEVRSDHSAVVYGDKIYFFGGQGNTGILNSLQFYDTQSQSWTNLSSCPQARYGHTAFEYNDEMFIWGGVLNTEDGDLFSLNSMWVYDFAKDEWRSETPGGEPRAFHSVIVYGDKAHFWGGFKVAQLAGSFIFFEDQESVINTQDIFNLRTRTWTSGVAGGTGRVTHGATNIGNKLIYLGGFNGLGGELSSVDTYTALTSSSNNRESFITELQVNGYRGDISIEISTVNTDELVNLDFEISLDAGESYRYLPKNHFEGLVSNILTTNSLMLTWHSTMEIRDNQDKVRLRVTPFTEDARKLPILSSILSVKNDSANRSPIATGLLLSGLRNDINLSINLSDPENDLLDLMFEYSLDNGNNWQITDNISGEFSGITVPTTHTFIWHSLLDIQLTTDVIVRVTPSDQGMSTASPMNSIIFTLNNSNTLPYTQIPQVSGAKHDLNITFDSIDADLAETLSYNFQYSVDSGNTWINSSNVKNLVSGLPSMNQTFVWNSLADIYDNQSNVQIRVIPQDSVSEGYAIPSVEFAINNNNWSEGIGLQRLRRGHTSIIFDQKIYVWGGVDTNNNLLNTIDIYDLRRGTWTRGKSGGTARRDHTANIHSGRIYFWGGRSDDGNLSSLDIYDIAQDQWLVGVSGGQARNGHSAIVYNQKIYYWGGLGFSSPINSMDIYDIVAQSWDQGPSGGTARSEHSAVLDDSRLIFWGGMNSETLLNSMDIFDLINESWEVGIQGGQARAGHTAVLHNNNLIVWGGYADGATNTINLFNINTNEWSQGDTGGTAREQHTAVEFEDQIFYFGGNNENGFAVPFDVYDIPTFQANNTQETQNQILIGNNQASDRRGHSSVSYQGRIYIWGGVNPTFLNTLEIYDPEQDSWNNEPSTSGVLRENFVMEQIKGKLVIHGGTDPSGLVTSDLDIYNIDTKSWSKGSSDGTARKNHAGINYNGKLYTWGGENQNGQLINSLEIYDSSSNNWFQRTADGTPRKSHCACEFEGKIYFWGGVDSNDNLVSTFDIYDINSNVWFEGPSSDDPRRYSSCESFEGKLYFIGGENELGITSSKMSIYDVGKNLWMQSISDEIFRRKKSSVSLINGQLYLWRGVNTTDLDFVTNNIYPMPRSSGSSWSEGQSGGTSRAYHSSIVADGRAIIWGGLTANGASNSVDIIDLNNHIYSTSSSGGTSRWNHTATHYEGRVYHWGGENESGKINSMDVFTLPPTGVQWLNGEPTIQAREKYGAQSYNGKFYIMGGQDPQGNYLDTLETFDVETKTWSLNTTMLMPKSLFSIVRSGEFIYIWGGMGPSGITSDIMIYDTNTNTFSHKAYIPDDKYRHSHASIAVGEPPNGKIYTFGGMAGEGFIRNSVDVYSIYNRSFSEGKTFTNNRYGHTASLMGTKIYLWGGETFDSEILNTLEIYDLTNDSWSMGIAGGTPRKFHSTVTLGTKLYYFGGIDQLGEKLNTVDIYDTETEKWERGVSGGNPRSFHTSLLQEGRIYNISGNTSGITSSVDIFIPEVSGDSLSSSIWSNGIPGGRNRQSHSSLTYGENIYYWGGQDSANQILNTLDIYNTSTGFWTEGQAGGRGRKYHKGFTYKQKLFFHGGEDISGTTTNSIDIYKIDSEDWAKGIRGGRQRKNHAIVEWNGRIYSWAGQDEAGNALNSLDVYDLDTWSRGDSGGDRRTDHNAISSDGKMYIFNGFGTGNLNSNVDVFDLENRIWLENIDTPTLPDPKSGASSCLMTGPSDITTGIYFWGGDGGQNPNKIQIYDLANQEFQTNGTNIGENREYASANCYDGKVYLWGGRPASGIATNQLDIYDARLNQLETGSIHNGGTARFGHTASLYKGKIYIWGGRVSQTGRTNSLDIYDIQSDSWNIGPSGGTPRSDHSAVIFQDKIFFYGGSVNTDAKKLDTVDVFDIANNEWQVGSESRIAYEGSSDNAKRAGHTAVLWNGQMFIWGGRDKDEIELNTLDILNLEQWRELKPGGTPRYMHAGAAFEDKLYFWGGTDGGDLFKTMDVYDTQSNEWFSGLEGGEARKNHSAVLDQGKIFFWGGENSTGFLNTVDIYEIVSSSWITGFFGGRSRTGHVANLVGSKIYHWGGRDDSAILNTTDVYSLTSLDNLWDTIPGPISEVGRSGHTATLVNDKIIFWGGEDSLGQIINTVSIYKLQEATWVTGATGGQPRKGHKASLNKGNIHYWGGVDSSGLPLNTIDIYDPNADQWITEGQSEDGIARYDHAQLEYLGNQISWAGKNESGNINSLDIYNFSDYSWQSGVSGGRSRSGHSVAVRNGKAYFWGGESYAGKYLNTMDILDMTTNSNNAPEIISMTLSAMPDALGYRDSVSISCIVSDNDDDLVSLSMEYSNDGGQSWFYIDQGHLTEPTVDLKSLESFNIIWNSTSDLPTNESSVLLRITPTDGEKSGTSKLIGPIILNNSGSWLSSISGPKAKSKADFIRRDASNQLILWGGEDLTREDSNTQEVFNYQTSTWTTEVPVTDFVVEARSDHSSVLFNNYIYHWGGRKNQILKNTFTVYDSSSDTWLENIAIAGGTARASHTANVYDSKMYIWGGEDNTGVLNSLEYYNFLADEWVYIGNGGTPRRGHSSVIYDNKLFFFGGEIAVNSEIELTDTIDIYDLAKGQWMVGHPSGLPLVNHQAVIDGHRMWVWGGSKGSGIYSNDLYIYDLNANTWSQGISGGTARRYHAAASVNGILYFFGGWNGSYLSTMDRYAISK